MGLKIGSFKPNSASMVATVINEETGEERKRLINKGRWKGYGPATVTFGDLNVGSCLGLLFFHLILHRSRKIRFRPCNKPEIK